LGEEEAFIIILEIKKRKIWQEKKGNHYRLDGDKHNGKRKIIIYSISKIVKSN